MREGKRLRATFVDVRLAASPLGAMRIGIVVPKYTHNSVERNRLKRRLRELLRRTVLPLALPLDVVVRARREGYAATFDDLARDVEQIRARLAS